MEAGLILEGGGMRGIYTAGVLDYFLDAGIGFSRIYGVSAGACHATSYLSGQRGRAMRTVTDYAGDRRYASAYSFVTTGDFFGVDMVYNRIPNQLLPFDFDAYAASKTQLFAVVTNCRTGQAEYIPVQNMREEIPVIQASSSLPLLSRMVQVGEELYLDGGIADSIPLGKALSDGYRKNVVILTQHQGYQKGPNSMMPLVKLRYRNYPQLVASVAARSAQYNHSLELVHQEREAGRTFVIQPGAAVTIGRLEKNVERLHGLYQQGYDDAQRQSAALKQFLAEE